MRFSPFYRWLLVATLAMALGVVNAYAGPLAVVTNFTSGTAPGTVTIIDTATDQLVGAPIRVGVNPAGVVITPDGRTAVVACADVTRDLWFIDLAANPPAVLGSVKVGDLGGGVSDPFSPFGLAVSPDGQYVVVMAAAGRLGAPGNQYVRVVSVKDRSVVQTLQMPQDEYPITAEAGAITSKGAIVLVGASTSLVYALGFQEGEIILPEGTADQRGTFSGAQGTNVSITPDGSVALITLGRRFVQALNIDETGKILKTTEPIASGGDGAQSIAVTADGKRAYVRNLISPGANIAVFDIQAGGTLTDTNIRLNCEGLPALLVALGGLWIGNPMVAVTPDGKKVYATRPDPFSPAGDAVYVFGGDNPTPVKRLSTGREPFGIAIQPKVP